MYRFTETVGNFTYQQLKMSSVDNYIDIDFIGWLIWLFTPVIVSKHSNLGVFIFKITF